MSCKLFTFNTFNMCPNIRCDIEIVKSLKLFTIHHQPFSIYQFFTIYPFIKHASQQVL